MEENRQLQDQHDISLRDNFEVTEFLRREIVTKDEKISLLQGKVDEVGPLTFCFCFGRQQCAMCPLMQCTGAELVIL